MLAHTVEAAPPLCPELRLRLMTEACGLYRADESAAARAGISLPYWATAWPGGQALARYLLDAPEVAKGQRVLDFGCGGSVAGIAAARTGAARVVANDVDPLAMEVSKANAALNHVSLELSCEDLVGQPNDATLVLAGDVCYQAEFTTRLIDWLHVLAEGGAVVLLADPGRGHLDRAALEPLAEYEVSFEGDPTGQLRRTTWVGKLKAR